MILLYRLSTVLVRPSSQVGVNESILLQIKPKKDIDYYDRRCYGRAATL